MAIWCKCGIISLWGALPELPPFILAVLTWLSPTNGSFVVGPTAIAMCKTAVETAGISVIPAAAGLFGGVGRFTGITKSLCMHTHLSAGDVCP